MEHWPVTFVVLTKDEAPRMARCLSSIKKAQRVLVMDALSEDGTVNEARFVWKTLERASGDLIVVQSEWKGFIAARNDSLAWVKTPWVFWLDADEWLEQPLMQELDHFFSELAEIPGKPTLYEIPRLTQFLGRKIYHGGWWPDRKCRLARSETCIWVPGPAGAQVHEDLRSLPNYPEKKGRFRAPIRHETFRTVQELKETNEHYSTLLAEGLAQKYFLEKRVPPSNFYIRVKMCVKFFENYIWKRGFLDAYPGWIIACGSAKSLKMRLQKMRALLNDMQKKNSQSVDEVVAP